MSLFTKLSAAAALLLPIAAGAVMNMACREQCAGALSCEDCVAECVESQEVSPEICRTTACATPCQQEGGR